MSCDASRQVQAYQAEFNRLLQQLLLGREQPPELLIPKQQQQLLLECQTCLKQMSLEVRDIQEDDVKLEWQERIKLYKSQLQSIQIELDRASLPGNSKSSASQKRSQGNQEKNVPASAAKTPTFLASESASLHSSLTILEQAKRSLAETEEIGTEIAQHLQENRSKIESSQARVQELSSLTTQASELLKSMSKKRMPWSSSS